jgi:hypothetical protein
MFMRDQKKLIFCILIASFIIMPPIFAANNISEKTENKQNESLQQAPPLNRVYLDSLTVARYNPLGLVERVRLMYSRRLINSTNPILRDTFFAIGAGLRVSPSTLYFGPVIEFQPIGILNFRVSYEYVRFFKTFDNLQSYPVAKARYSDRERDKSKGNAYASYGHHVIAEPSLQFKISYFALKSTFGLEYFAVHLRRKFDYRYWNVDMHKDKFFYESTQDSLTPNYKFVWSNDTNLMFIYG